MDINKVHNVIPLAVRSQVIYVANEGIKATLGIIHEQGGHVRDSQVTTIKNLVQIIKDLA